MKKILILMFLLLTLNLIAQEPHDYEIEKIRTIPLGSAEGQIGLREISKTIGSIIPGVVTLTISSDNKIYVPDLANERLNVYDMNLNYLYRFDEKRSKKNASTAYKIEVDGEAFIYAASSYFQKMDKNGNDVYSIYYDKLPREFMYNLNYFVIDGMVYFYNDEFQVHSIDKTGKIEKTDMAEIVVNGNYYNANFGKFKEYFKRKGIDVNKNKLGIDLDSYSYFKLIGYDADYNSYWDVDTTSLTYIDKWAIAIYSKKGELIDIFWYHRLIDNNAFNGRNIRISIAPNGDVYFMRLDENGCHFFRVKHRWGLDQEKVEPKKVDYLRPASITASSTLTEPTDRNAYSPAKVFDAKPETGWMEKKDGPGIGEWVKISFDQPVTADRLMVSPGYFDSRYWQDNNRVKRLLISLDNYTQFVDFTDNMTPQEVSLGKARTFSSATFTIVEVFKNSHWDDTAIAEIEFWNDGGKLEIDLSGFEDRLKIVPE